MRTWVSWHFKFWTGSRIIRRARVLGRLPLSPDNCPPGLREILRYRFLTFAKSGRRVYDPYVRYFFHDPLVSLLWWAQFSTWLYGQRKDLGS